MLLLLYNFLKTVPAANFDGDSVIIGEIVFLEGITMKTLYKYIIVILVFLVIPIAQVKSQGDDPDGNKIIGPDNLENVVVLDRFGQGIIRDIEWLSDNHTIAMANSTFGVQLYDLSEKDKKPYTLDGSFSKASSVSASSDGLIIAAGEIGTKVGIWDLATTEASIWDAHSSEVIDVTLNPQGSLLATMGNDGTVKVWSTDDVTLIHSFEIEVPYTSPITSTKRLIFHPEQNILFALTSDRILSWNVSTGEQVGIIRDGSMIEISPDGDTILAAGGSTFFAWDTVSYQRGLKYVGTEFARNTDVDISSSGIVAASNDQGTINLWDLTGKKLRELKGHTNTVEKAAFSPDGTRLVSSSWDGTVRLWDLNTFQSQILLSGYIWYSYLKFSLDGQYLAVSTSDNSIRVFDMNHGIEYAVLRGHLSDINGIEYREAAPQLISVGEDGTLRAWYINSLQSSTLYGFGNDIQSLAMNETEELLALIVGPKIYLWNLAGYYIQSQWNVVGDRATWAPGRVVFSPDSSRVGIIARALQVWDVQDKEVTGTIAPRGYIIDYEFVSSDRILLTSRDSNTGFASIELWETTGSKIDTFISPTNLNSALNVAISPTKEILATGGSNLVGLWDLESPEVFILSEDGRLPEFNAVGTLFATSGEVIRIWGLEESRTSITDAFVYQNAGSTEIPTCYVSPRYQGSVRLYSEPDRNSRIVELLPWDQSVFVDGQYTTESGEIWFRIAHGKWIEQSQTKDNPVCENLKGLVRRE